MEQQQRQLAILEEALKTRKRIDAIQEENDQIKESLATKQAILARLNQMSLAAASLIGSVDNTAETVEPTSLACLSKLDQSNAVVGEKEEEEEDTTKMIAGKYLNQILAVIVDDIQKGNGGLNLISLMDLETKLNQLFAFAEEKEIIPETDGSKGWKKAMIAHQGLFEKIQGLLGSQEQ